MILRALHTRGILDIGHSTDKEPYLTLALKPGQVVTIDDKFRVLKNIDNAINLGLLEIISYNSSTTDDPTQVELNATQAELDADKEDLASHLLDYLALKLKLDSLSPGGKEVFFDTSYVETGSEPMGTAYWDASNETLATRLQNGAILQHGQEIHFYARATNADIPNGTLVQYAGTTGAHIVIKKAVASEIIENPEHLVGVATTNISKNDYGYVTSFGKVNDIYTKTPSNGDTSNWTEGQILYFDNATGQMTNVEPNAPDRRITVAAVIKEQDGATESGKIFVRPTWGLKMTDLNDVNGTPLTENGQFPVWDEDRGVFDFVENINNYLKYSSPSELTISSGSITMTRCVHTVDGEGDANDYLDTINGNWADGQMIFIRPENTGRAIFLTSGIGNIITPTGSIYRLPDDAFTGLIYDENALKWRIFSQPQETQWTDLRIPLNSTKLGGSKDPGFEKVLDNGAGSQGVFAYAFDPALEEELYFVVQFGHDYKLGTTIHPHVHWVPSLNGAAGQTVNWGMEYSWSNIGSVFGNTTIISDNVTFPNDSSLVANKHYLTEIGEIDGSAIDTVSSMLICRIFRDATGSLKTDSYTSDAYLLEIDFHYEIDSLGSREEYTKY